MEYEEFEKITEMWSYNDMVAYMMEDDRWCDAIMWFIRDNWEEADNNITLDALNAFGKSKGYAIQTKLEFDAWNDFNTKDED